MTMMKLQHRDMFHIAWRNFWGLFNLFLSILQQLYYTISAYEHWSMYHPW